MQPATEADKAHFAEATAMIKSRWTLSSECLAKLQARGMEEIKAEFIATWTAADTNDDNRLNETEFVDFAEKNQGNMKAISGEGPEFDADIAKKTFATVLAIAGDGADSIA